MPLRDHDPGRAVNVCALYTHGAACHFSGVRSLIPALLVLACVPAFAADKEKPLGRTPQQRFNATMEEQQALVFDTRQGAVGGGRAYEAGKAQTKGFQFGKSFAAASYETGKFQTKKSWLDRFKFGTKSANVAGTSEVPGAKETYATKKAQTKDSREGEKTAAVNELPSANREYRGPERQKLDQAIDPKTLADWRTGGETVVRTSSTVERYHNLKQLSVEDVREILNKNK